MNKSVAEITSRPFLRNAFHRAILPGFRDIRWTQRETFLSETLNLNIRGSLWMLTTALQLQLLK